MADIKVSATFILPGRVLRAETPVKNKKGEKRKEEELYYQETLRFKNDKPIVINLRKGVPATQVLHISYDAYKGMIAQDNPAKGVTPYEWRKLSNKKRLQSHLNLVADTLNGVLESFTVLDD